MGINLFFKSKRKTVKILERGETYQISMFKTTSGAVWKIAWRIIKIEARECSAKNSSKHATRTSHETIIVQIMTLITWMWKEDAEK